MHPERGNDARCHHTVPRARNCQKRIEYQDVNGQRWWNKKLPEFAPIHLPISDIFLKKSWVQVLQWTCLKRLLAYSSNSSGVEVVVVAIGTETPNTD
jgi:hypothetical protein